MNVHRKIVVKKIILISPVEVGNEKYKKYSTMKKSPAFGLVLSLQFSLRFWGPNLRETLPLRGQIFARFLSLPGLFLARVITSLNLFFTWLFLYVTKSSRFLTSRFFPFAKIKSSRRNRSLQYALDEFWIQELDFKRRVDASAFANLHEVQAWRNVGALGLNSSWDKKKSGLNCLCSVLNLCSQLRPILTIKIFRGFAAITITLAKIYNSA